MQRGWGVSLLVTVNSVYTLDPDTKQHRYHRLTTELYIEEVGAFVTSLRCKASPPRVLSNELRGVKTHINKLKRSICHTTIEFPFGVSGSVNVVLSRYFSKCRAERHDWALLRHNTTFRAGIYTDRFHTICFRRPQRVSEGTHLKFTGCRRCF